MLFPTRRRRVHPSSERARQPRSGARAEPARQCRMSLAAPGEKGGSRAGQGGARSLPRSRRGQHRAAGRAASGDTGPAQPAPAGTSRTK